MSGYDDLNSAFEAILANTSRFVPMAFHVHSPGSSEQSKRRFDAAAKKRAEYPLLVSRVCVRAG